VIVGRPTVRKALILQRAQDDPRSECRRPKGSRKPGLRYRLLRRRVSA
jgi:hypothetical protein